MILFNAAQNGTAITVNIFGDGTSTTLTIPLDVPPLNLDLKGNLPVGIAHASFTQGPMSASLGSDRKSVVLTFSTPPPAPPSDGTASFILEFAGI